MLCLTVNIVAVNKEELTVYLFDIVISCSLEISGTSGS